MIKFDKRFKSEHGTAVYALAVVGLLIGIVIASVILESAKGSMSESGKETLKTALNIIFQIVNVIVLMLFLSKTRAKPDYFIKVKIPKIYYALGVVFGLLSIFCFIGLSNVGQILLDKIGYNLQPAYVKGIPLQNFFLLAVTVFLAPVLEELIFRGALLSGLNKRFEHIQNALLCAVAFAFMHMNPEQTLYQFCLGFGAAMLTFAAGSVIPAIIMHLTSNFVAAMAMIGVRGFTDFFDFYERVFMKNTGIFVFSTVLLTIVGAAAFIFITKAIAERYAIKEGEKAPPMGKTVEVVPEKEEEPIKPKVRRGLFRNFNDTTMIYYGLTLGLTVFMWAFALIAGLN